MSSVINGNFPDHRKVEFVDEKTGPAEPDFFGGTPFRKPRPRTISMAMHTSGFSVNDLLFGYDEERAQRDQRFIQCDPPTIELVAKRVERMRVLLFETHPMLENELQKVSERRMCIMGIEFGDLCRQIAAGDETYWQRLRPQFAALVLEFIGRVHQAETWVSNQRT